MPASAPRDSTLAVVGDGFGSLIVYSTAVYLGFKPEEITIYGPSDNPVGTYQQFAYNLGQTVLRSESESHFLPADWPTFAELDAWSHRSLAPLVRSTKRKYNPGVSEILTEAGVVPAAPELGRLARAGARRLAAARGGPGALRPLRRGRQLRRALQARDARARPRPARVPGRRWPRRRPPTPRSTTASCRPTRPRATTPTGATSSSARASRRSTSGPTRSTSAPSASRCGATPRPTSRTSTCRAACSSRSASTPSPACPSRQRVQFLGNVLKGTTPRRRSWLEQDRAAAAREGRFEELLGEIDTVERGPAGPARPRLEPLRRGPRLARRHRRRRRHRLQQVGAHPAAAAPARRALRHPGRRTAASSCARTAASRASTARTRGCA